MIKPFTRLAIACALLTISTAISSCQVETPVPTLHYGLTLSPSGLDPHLNASAELGIPLQSVYDTLIIRDPTSGEFLPSLALAWHISADGLVYTFSLRQDVYFHDGTAFDAEAAVANFAYTVNPDNHSQKAAAMLGPFESAIALDPYTLQIQLSKPFSPLLDSLSQVYLGIASPQALETWGPGEYQFHQVGTGPYRFVEFIPDDRIVLERFPEYAWGPSVYQQRTAQIERIEFHFYEDEATRALALERGELDIIGELPPRDALRLSDQDGYTLLPVPIPGQPLQFFLNASLAPTDDVLVRRALVAAVDKQRIIQTIFAELSPIARGPLSAFPFAPALPDPEPGFSSSAMNLLEQAGWIDADQDGVREKNGQPLSLKLIAPPWGSNPEVAQLIKADWETLGAQVDLTIVPSFGALKQSQSEGRYHAIGLNFFGTDPDLIRPFLHSDGVYNWSQVHSESLDQLLNDASNVTDIAMRNRLYRQAVSLINEQALILPIRDYINLVVHRDSISNLRFSAQGWFPYLIDLEFES